METLLVKSLCSLVVDPDPSRVRDMGKRKSSSKPVTKQKVKLDTTFDCLFCNHEKAVSVKMYYIEPRYQRDSSTDLCVETRSYPSVNWPAKFVVRAISVVRTP